MKNIYGVFAGKITNSKTENNVNMDPKRSECGHQSRA